MRALGGTYTMPTGAAALQTKLRDLGFSDAAVIASSDVDWRIDLPGINYSSYSTVNKIYWPSYLVPNDQGAVVNVCDGYFFTGSFINSSGERCALSKQFARLGITTLKL